MFSQETQGKHEEEQGAAHIKGAGDIHVGPGKGAGIFEEDDGQDHQDDADRQIDIEYVAPGIPAHDPPSQVGADDAPYGEDAGEKTYRPFPAFGKVIGHDPRCARKKAGPSYALKEPECDEGMDVGRKTAGKRAEGEQAEGNEEKPFAAEGVAEVPRQRHRRGDADKKNGNGPRGPEHVGAQLSYEVGEGDGHHRAVNGVHQKRETGTAEDEITSHTLVEYTIGPTGVKQNAKSSRARIAAEAIFDAEREAWACPGRSVLLYMRTRTRPGDKAMRKKRLGRAMGCR